MEPLYEAHKRFVLSCPVLHADETPVAMLDPGAGKTKRAYIWAYARGELDAQRGVIYEFCLGRGSQYPVAFLGASQGPPGSPMRRTTGMERHAGVRSVRRVRPRARSDACTRSALPHIAPLMPDASSTNWSAPARWPRRRSSALAGSTTSRVSSRDGRAAAPGGARAAHAAAVEGAARLAEARARPRAGRRLDRRARSTTA